MITSINLSKRNEIVYKREFDKVGCKGRFSAWVNNQLDKEFKLNGIEHLQEQIGEINQEQDKLESRKKELIEKIKKLKVATQK